MSAPAPPRPHTRARTQLLLGLVPLLLICAVLLTVLGLRLAAAQRPLAAATAVAAATVESTGQPPQGRGVAVTFEDGGTTRHGVLVFHRPVRAARGTEVAVQYDPSSPAGHTAVYADGDSAHKAVQDVVFGLIVVGLVALAATAVTLARVRGRTRLRGRRAGEAVGSRVVVRTGLLVRSWLELTTSSGSRWLPVYWAPELADLPPDGRIELRGDPARDRLVLPVVNGAEVWPSGRLRRGAPRGERRTAAPEAAAPQAGWGRQVRADVLPAVFAPVLGLAWAYVDDSGAAGFVVATALAAGVLFWFVQLLGSDPAPPER